ncbi:hypothetical protein CP533_0368 [Ophiocordyceps camponoti-saundersi (nom. inval.)]|nr:hypothetical protein CP533_0368 [Ophiocordyceps camponoti-saundersi (nom. inval.)]
MGQKSWSLVFVVLVGIISSVGLSADARRFRLCHNYVLISARGTRETAGPSLGFTDMIRLTLAKAPGGIEYDVRYPAKRDYTQLTTLIGVADIRRRIEQGLVLCPKQQYALLGYSQGATATLAALREMRGSEAERAIGAVVLLGNPYQVPGQLSTVDELGGSSTRNRTGALLKLAPSIGLSDEWDASGKVLSICYGGDPVCSGVGLDTQGKEHVFYGFSFAVQYMGAKFLIDRLEGYRPYVPSKAEERARVIAQVALAKKLKEMERKKDRAEREQKDQGLGPPVGDMAALPLKEEAQTV